MGQVPAIKLMMMNDDIR